MRLCIERCEKWLGVAYNLDKCGELKEMCGVHESEAVMWVKTSTQLSPPPGREFVQDGRFGKLVNFVESIKILKIRPAKYCSPAPFRLAGSDLHIINSSTVAVANPLRVSRTHLLKHNEPSKHVAYTRHTRNRKMITLRYC